MDNLSLHYFTIIIKTTTHYIGGYNDPLLLIIVKLASIYIHLAHSLHLSIFKGKDSAKASYMRHRAAIQYQLRNLVVVNINNRKAAVCCQTCALPISCNRIL